MRFPSILRLSAGKSLCLLLFLVFAFAAHAQFDQGQIAGTVTDSSQAVVPRASVTARSIQTGQTVSATTEQSGSYTLTNLPVGAYELTVEAAGFKKHLRTNVVVVSATRATVDVVLEVGATTESITVSAPAMVMSAETAQIGRTVEARQITDLALNGRNPYNLAFLKAGVMGDDFNSFNPGVVYMGFAVNGGKRNGNEVTVDGVSFQRARGDSDNHTVLGVLNVDAIEEVQLLTATYPAEYGRGMDGQIRFVTKSGTREFHGSAWHFMRNSVLDANSWTRNSSVYQSEYSRPAPFRFNQPGYSIGGPVVIPGTFNTERNKAFFFVSQEWMWYRKEYTNVGTVPTLAMRKGDFSELLDAANPFFRRVRLVNDPTTGKPLPGNIIPVGLRSKNGLALLSAFPEPAPGFQLGTNNWIKSLANPIGQRKDTIRADYYSGSHRFSFSGTHFSYQEDTPFAGLGAPFGLGLDRGMRRWDRPNMTGAFRVTSTLSPTKVNDVTVTAAVDIVRIDVFETEGKAKYKRSIYGIDYPYVYPGTKVIEDRLPAISISGFTGIAAAGNPPISSTGPMFSLADNFSWILRSNHTLKFGVFVERVIQNNNELTGNQNGSFSFTDLTSPVTSSLAVSNVALGNFDSYSEASTRPYTSVASNAVEAYAQDTWKVTPNLTLEMGLRYSFRAPWVPKWNDLAEFDPSYYDPAKRAVVHPKTGLIVSGDQYNGIVMPGSGIPAEAKGRNNAVELPNYQRLFHDLPRGFVNTYRSAFAPRVGIAWRLADKTAIRMGGGVFHHRQMMEGWLWGQAPTQISVTKDFGSVDNPVGAGALLYPLSHRRLDPTHKYPTAYTYSLSIQRQLPFAMVVDLAYVGKTRINQVRGRDMNRMAAGTLQANPGVTPDALRPWHGLRSITLTTLDGRSNYNSLQISLDRRFNSGLGFGLSYTFAKTLTDINTDLTGMKFAKALDNWDRPHIFNLNSIYELPFLRQGRGLAGAALGGWQLSGVVFIRSGQPSSVTTSVDYAGVGPGSQPWDLVGSLAYSGERGVGKYWFNPAAFAAPPSGRFGNAGRNIIRSPGYLSSDLAIFKTFRIVERLRADLRVEAFNWLNHPLLGGPGTDPRSGNFALVTSKSGERNVQFGLKFVF